MVKSGSDDFGGWILKLLTTFQSSVCYLRDQSHQPNSSRCWQCSCLVSALFWGREDITHEVNANISSSSGALYISSWTSRTSNWLQKTTTATQQFNFVSCRDKEPNSYYLRKKILSYFEMRTRQCGVFFSEKGIFQWRKNTLVTELWNSFLLQRVSVCISI